MASSLRAVLADALPHPKHSFTEIVEALGSSAGTGGEMMTLGSSPPRVPNQDAGEYIIFLAHVQAGLNFPLSCFTDCVLDSYGIRLGNLAPNSVLMMATFAYLCEAFIGVRPCMVLWRHFFMLRSSGGDSATFGSCRFQTRSSPRTEYIHCNFSIKWDHWKRSWFYLRMEVNERLRVSRSVTTFPEWEACPEIDEAWEPALERIEALRAAGLHTMVLLTHYTASRCCGEPHQSHVHFSCYARFGRRDGHS
ncbi:hypothetical protein U9M48_043714 [Paspalum notatum var. saurae]|uniref:Transposase (putative) gypsy type domain-containing protein n=1 Tax=Paspalum notatum var. saurae TaxID=547442 RepID=A0AAQ3UTB8_PASNO